MVFDFLTGLEGEVMQMMDMCVLNNDKEILASLLLYAIEIGKQNKASLFVFWANNQEMDIFFHNKFKMSWPAHYSSFIRFSETQGINSDSFNVYSSIIDPPQGIDH
jgi:hypothetical protein